MPEACRDTYEWTCIFLMMNNLGHLHLCMFAFIAYLLHSFNSSWRREWLQDKSPWFRNLEVQMDYLFVLAVLIILLDSKSGSHCNRYCTKPEWWKASVPGAKDLKCKRTGKAQKSALATESVTVPLLTEHRERLQFEINHGWKKHRKNTEGRSRETGKRRLKGR